MALAHVEQVQDVCNRFLRTLLKSKCPRDVESRVWASVVEDALKTRNKSASDELNLLLKDLKNYPINYNHYYTDAINKRRARRTKALLRSAIESSYVGVDKDSPTSFNIEALVDNYVASSDPNMENFSCQEALDCLFAIYKVSTQPVPPFTGPNSQSTGYAKGIHCKCDHPGHRAPHCSRPGENL
jgi:hypothetical protein